MISNAVLAKAALPEAEIIVDAPARRALTMRFMKRRSM